MLAWYGEREREFCLCGVVFFVHFSNQYLGLQSILEILIEQYTILEILIEQYKHDPSRMQSGYLVEHGLSGTENPEQSR